MQFVSHPVITQICATRLVSSFSILRLFRWPIEPTNVHRFGHMHMLAYTKWEHWPLTITKGVQPVPLKYSTLPPQPPPLKLNHRALHSKMLLMISNRLEPTQHGAVIGIHDNFKNPPLIASPLSLDYLIRWFIHLMLIGDVLRVV